MSEEYPKTTMMLVRHGQAGWDNNGEYGRAAPLTDLGRAQAAALASEFGVAAGVTALYTSPFPRAVNTADAISETLGLEPVVDPRLAEFELEGVTLENAKKQHLLIWKPDHGGASGETLADFCIRVQTFHKETARAHLGERVAIVSHVGTIVATLRWSLGISPNAPWENDFEVPNASITELEHWPRGRVSGGAPRYTALKRVGDVTHLGELATDI